MIGKGCKQESAIAVASHAAGETDHTAISFAPHHDNNLPLSRAMTN